MERNTGKGGLTMGITAKDPGGSGDYTPVDEGMHRAVCYSVYDLGTHYQEAYGKNVHKVLIIWELPDERIDIERDGKMLNLPRAISRRFTLSLHKKSDLRKTLESWRGKTFTPEELKGFDLTKLLGVNGTIQVLHNKVGEKTYANIINVVPLMKGMEKIQPENPMKYFSFEESTNLPDGIPDWISEIIKSANEWGGNETQNYDEPPPYDDSEIPF